MLIWQLCHSLSMVLRYFFSISLKIIWVVTCSPIFHSNGKILMCTYIYFFISFQENILYREHSFLTFTMILYVSQTCNYRCKYFSTYASMYLKYRSNCSIWIFFPIPDSNWLHRLFEDRRILLGRKEMCRTHTTNCRINDFQRQTVMFGA